MRKAILTARLQIVIHMAAQPIVRESYKAPVDTFSTNVMGTVNVLEAARACSSVRAVVNVTTDKVYENVGKRQGYRELDPLGGYAPYSSSKAGSELVAQAYTRSYNMNLATARAGNVIGGGDWAVDRLVPDFVRTILKKKSLVVRNPKATRPWQHVLEPLNGYLILAAKLFVCPGKFTGAWNFGPDDRDAKTVAWLVRQLCAQWGKGVKYRFDDKKQLHETYYLRLNSAKARSRLGWKPKWRIDQALGKIIEWTQFYISGKDVRKVCLNQVKNYMES